MPLRAVVGASYDHGNTQFSGTAIAAAMKAAAAQSVACGTSPTTKVADTTPTSGTVPLTVAFSAAGSSDADGSIATLAQCHPQLSSGVLWAAERGEAPWPSPVYARDWPRAQVGAFSPLPAGVASSPSLGAEHAVAGIAQAGDDVAMVVELPVDRGGVDRHVRVVGVEA